VGADFGGRLGKGWKVLSFVLLVCGIVLEDWGRCFPVSLVVAVFVVGGSGDEVRCEMLGKRP
jgi:hypothetical protein